VCRPGYLFNHLFLFVLFPAKIMNQGKKLTAKNKKPHSIQEMGFQFPLSGHRLHQSYEWKQLEA
jgi:hypothetical protein